MKLRHTTVIVSLTAAVIVLVYIVSFFSHQIFGSIIYPFLLAIGTGICLVSGIFFIAYIYGGMVLRLFHRQGKIFLPEWYRNVLSAGLGLGLLALSVVLVGLFVGFYRPVFIVLFTVSIVAVFPILRLQIRNQFTSPGKYNKLPDEEQKNRNYFTPCVILFIVVCFLMVGYFLSALTPPVSYDVLEYHLSAPKELIHSHSFAIYPYIFFVHLPLNMEMLFTLGMILERTADAVSPKLIVFGVLVLLVGTVYYWLRESRFSKSWALLGVVLLLSHSIIMRSSVDAMNDLAVCLWVFLAILCWSFWTMTPKCAYELIVLAGSFIGLGIGTKYTVIFLYLFPFLLILTPSGLWLKSKAIREKVKVSQIIIVYVIFIAGVVATFLPWAVKNLVINHNPLYPFMSAVFPSDHWTPTQEAFYLSCRQPIAPWSSKFWTNCLERSTTPGLLYFLTALLSLLIPAKDIKIARIKPMVVFSLVAYLIWNLWATSADRFLVAIIPILVGATILLLWWLWHQSRLGKTITVIFCFAIGLNTAVTLTNFVVMDVPRYGVLIGLRDEFRKNYLGEFSEAIVYARENLPSDSKLLLLFEARPYYFEQPVVVNSVFDQSPLLIWLDEIEQEKMTSKITLSDLIKKLKEEGITHCLVNEYELFRLIQFYTPEQEKKEAGFPQGTTEEFFPLYPPWLHDNRFSRYRSVIKEFLDTLKERAEFRTSGTPITIYISSLDSLI